MTCVVMTGALVIFNIDGAVAISDSAFSQNTAIAINGGTIQYV